MQGFGVKEQPDQLDRYRALAAVLGLPEDPEAMPSEWRAGAGPGNGGDATGVPWRPLAVALVAAGAAGLLWGLTRPQRA